jgi:hypothetical protein
LRQHFLIGFAQTVTTDELSGFAGRGGHGIFQLTGRACAGEFLDIGQRFEQRRGFGNQVLHRLRIFRR